MSERRGPNLNWQLKKVEQSIFAAYDNTEMKKKDNFHSELYVRVIMTKALDLIWLQSPSMAIGADHIIVHASNELWYRWKRSRLTIKRE